MDSRDKYFNWYFPELAKANTREKAKQFAILASAGSASSQQIAEILQVLAIKMPEPHTAQEESLLGYLKQQEGEDVPLKTLKDAL